MWSILNGTIVNVCTVAAGSAVGLSLAARIPDRYQRIILDCLGLVTIFLGIDASVMVMSRLVGQYGAGIQAYGARLAMVTVGALLVGAIIGTALRLHQRLETLGRTIHQRFAEGAKTELAPAKVPADQSRSFAEGFLSASVIFCVGPLTLLGCLNNGAHADPGYLYVKSLLDCFCSVALAASLGLGVAFSVLTVFFFQGSLAVAAYYLAGNIPELSLQLMNVVGGLVLLATALMLLEIKKIPVTNLLPAIFLPPLVVWLTELISPGTLITASGPL